MNVRQLSSRLSASIDVPSLSFWKVHMHIVLNHYLYSSSFCESLCYDWLKCNYSPTQETSTSVTMTMWNDRFFLWALFCWWRILNCWLKPLATSHACTSAGGDWKCKGVDVCAVRGGVRREEPLLLASRSRSSSFMIRTGNAQNYSHSWGHIFPCPTVHSIEHRTA